MFRSRQFTQLLQAFEDGSVLQQKEAIQDCLPHLEKLLDFKGKAQETRAQLEAGAGPFAAKDLNESDKSSIRNFSDALNLNEEVCMNLLMLAHEEGRPVTAEHAAHIYLEERCNILQALNRMLHIKLDYLPASDPGSLDIVEQLLNHLASDKVASDAGRSPLARLCVIAQDTTLCTPSAMLQSVEDAHGGVFPISTLALAERAQAAQALFLIVAAYPAARAKPSDAVALLSVLAQADAAITNPTTSSSPLSHTLHPVLYALTAFAMLMNPPWAAEAGRRGAEHAAFADLTASREVAAAVAGLRDNESGVGAIVRFVFGVAGSALHERLDSFENAKASTGMVGSAVDVGALNSLRQYPAMAAFKDLWPEVRQAVSGTFLQIVLRYVDIFVTDSPTAPSDAVIAANAWVAKALESTGGGYGGSALGFPGSMGGGSESRRDGPASLLRCLAALLHAHGGGAAVAAGAESFSPGMPPEAMEAFVGLVRFAGRTPELACAADEDEALTGTGAALQTVRERCAYLELMRAYASDTWSAQQVALQLRDNRAYDGYKQLSWHAAFRRLALVHALFRNFPDDSSTELPVATQDEVEDLEESVLVATSFLQLMRVVLDRNRQAGEAQLKSVREGLSGAYADCRSGLGGSLREVPPTYEELIISVRSASVATLPVPANLKAAAFSTIGAHLLEPSDARNLLTRLTNSPLADRARAVANLAAQLGRATVEAACSTMEELTAYVQLFNRIVATGGADMVASELDSLLPHTEFIITHLLIPIAKRPYATASDMLALATACLYHLTLLVQAYTISAGDPCSHIFRDSAAPHAASTALSHLLALNSTLLRELFTHVLNASASLETPAVDHLARLRAHEMHGLHAEAAVAALFDLILAVFELDVQWVALQKRRGALVDPMHVLLLRNPVVALQLMQFARYDFSPWLQAAAIRVTGTLAARDPSVTQMMTQMGDHAGALVHGFSRCLGSRAIVPAVPDVLEYMEEADPLARTDGAAPRGGKGCSVPEGVGDDDGGGLTLRGLVLQVLLDCAGMPFPNMAQLLLGYYVQGSVDHLAAGPLPHAPSCIGALEDILKSRYLAQQSTPPFVAAWQAVRALSDTGEDGGALLRHLTASGTLPAALHSPLWYADTTAEVASRALYCKAWILGCCALQLMAFQKSPDHPDATKGTLAIIQNLLEASDDNSVRMRGAVPGEGRLRGALVACLGSLEALGGVDLGRSWREEKVAAADVKELELAAALEDTSPVAEGGLLYHDSMHGVWLYEGDAVQARLMGLKQAYQQRPEVRAEEGMAGKDAALSAAVRQAAAWNEGQLLLGAGTFLAQFWSAVAQLVFVRHRGLCEEAAGLARGTGPATLAPLLQEVVVGALQRVEALCALPARDAAVGLALGPPSTAIMHLLQGVHSLLEKLASMVAATAAAVAGGKQSHSAAAQLAALQPPRVAREVTSLLLRTARALQASRFYLDDRSDLLSGVHACLLSHLSASRLRSGAAESAMHARVPLSPLVASPLNATPTPSHPPSAAAVLGDDLCRANAEAIQAQGLGVALAKGMRHLLDSSAVATGGADGTALALSATAQHTLGLHALNVVLAADSSGNVASALGETGVLGAILDSLGSCTAERLHAAPNLLRESLALTEAHFMLLQTYVTAGSAAHCVHRARDLLSRGLLTALRNSGVLHLRQPPPSGVAQKDMYAALSSLRASALRATLTAAIQFGGNKEAAAEVARLLVSAESGCLGSRCADILAASCVNDAHPRDVEQAECVVELFALVAPVAYTLDAQYQDVLSQRREDILETFSQTCMRTWQLRGSGHLRATPPLTGGVAGGAAAPLRTASPLALPPAHGVHALRSSTPTRTGPAAMSPLLAGGFTRPSSTALALVTQAPSPAPGGGAEGGPADPRVPWMLVMHCLNFVCVALWGCGPDSEPLSLWPPAGYSAGGGLRRSGRRGYMDVALVLDLLSAVYEAYLPLARAGPSATRAMHVSPLLATPPLQAPERTHGADASAAQSQRLLLAQVAERAFAVVLACMRHREQAMYEPGDNGTATALGRMPAEERDALRAFLQRAAASVEEWAEVVESSAPLMDVLRALRECYARMQAQARSAA